MARPAKDVDSKRTFTFRVRVTPAEKILLKKLAAEAGLTASDFMRGKSLHSHPLFRKATPERAELIKGLAELGKIGSNLNQMARVLNLIQGKKVNETFTMETLDRALRGLDALTDEMINILQSGH